MSDSEKQSTGNLGKGNKNKKKDGLRGMGRKFLQVAPMLWPKKNLLLQIFIISSFAILIAIRGISVLIPIYYKKIGKIVLVLYSGIISQLLCPYYSHTKSISATLVPQQCLGCQSGKTTQTRHSLAAPSCILVSGPTWIQTAGSIP